MDWPEALRRIRRIVGPEVCGSVSPVAKRWRKVDREGSEEVQRAVEITYRLRLTLAALLVAHTEDPKRCPLCGESLPEREPGCMLQRLLDEEAGER